jgi:myo-inositol-1(or 4)-monophosphatase
LWDYAAGWLILVEAGGHACGLEHDDFQQANVWRRSTIAALDERLFEEWKRWIRAQR